MSKGTRFLAAAVPATLVYLLMLFAILPVPLVDHDTADLILPVVSRMWKFPLVVCWSSLQNTAGHEVGLLPWWLLVCFGSYSLMSLGLGLVRFHDTPDAYESLLTEITQAKNELRDQGVTVD